MHLKLAIVQPNLELECRTVSLYVSIFDRCSVKLVIYFDVLSTTQGYLRVVKVFDHDLDRYVILSLFNL